MFDYHNGIRGASSKRSVVSRSFRLMGSGMFALFRVNNISQACVVITQKATDTFSYGACCVLRRGKNSCLRKHKAFHAESFD